MGKYMRKAKTNDEVAVMEVASHQLPLGVRTRARTLALQRLQKPPPPEEQPPTFYLQLRSRRLEKPPPPPTPKVRPEPLVGSSSVSISKSSVAAAEEEQAEVSFGENVLVLEARERNIRETTPCSLIRDSEFVLTPGSTTRPYSTATNIRTQNSTHRSIPTTREMEEFFAKAEQLHQRIFAEKYNFDPVNDCPLPGGRYQWVKLDC